MSEDQELVAEAPVARDDGPQEDHDAAPRYRPHAVAGDGSSGSGTA